MPDSKPEAIDQYEAAKTEVKKIRSQQPDAGIEHILRVADKRFSHTQLAYGLVEADQEERNRSILTPAT